MYAPRSIGKQKAKRYLERIRTVANVATIVPTVTCFSHIRPSHNPHSILLSSLAVSLFYLAIEISYRNSYFVFAPLFARPLSSFSSHALFLRFFSVYFSQKCRLHSSSHPPTSSTSHSIPFCQNIIRT